MKYAKNLLVVFLCSLLSVLVISCSETDLSAEKTANVSICFSNTKALTVQESCGDLTYFYTAVPEFEGHAYGKTTKPVEIDLDGGTADLGEFSQGSWVFTLTAKDSDDKTVMSGSSKAVIKSGAANTVQIYLTRNLGAGNGTLNVDFTGPYTGAGDYSLVLKYRKVAEPTYKEKSDVWTCTASTSGVSYKGTFELSCGNYEFVFLYLKDGLQLGGETIAASIVASEVTGISGSIESGLNVKPMFVVNGVSSGEATYSGSATTFSGLDTVLWWDSKSITIDSYRWKLNGTDVNCHVAAYTFNETEAGTYTVECFASAGYSELKAVFTVEVKPKTTVEIFNLRCNPGSGKVCIGYKDSNDNPNPFPLKFSGEINAAKEPSYYGLVAVTADCSDMDTLSSASFIQVNEEWDRSYLGSYVSVVGSTSKSRNSSLQNAVIQADLSAGGLNYCKGLGTVVFGSGATKIPNGCLMYDTSLYRIYISKNVTSVGLAVFSGCNSLQKIYLEKGSQLTRESFDGLSESVTIVTDCEGEVFK